MHSKYIPPLIIACLKISRQRSTKNDSILLDTHVNLLNLKVEAIDISNTVVDENNISDTMNTENISSVQAAVINDQIDAASTVADCVLLRQSALSVLAETVVISKGSSCVLKYINDILDLTIGIFTIETNQFKQNNLSVQAKINIRRYEDVAIHYFVII
jgi:hypothetical protein